MDKTIVKVLIVMMVVSIIVEAVVLANHNSFSSISPNHLPTLSPFLLPPPISSLSAQPDAKLLKIKAKN